MKKCNDPDIIALLHRLRHIYFLQTIPNRLYMDNNIDAFLMHLLQSLKDYLKTMQNGQLWKKKVL